MDQTDVPDDLHHQWHEPQANNYMQKKYQVPGMWGTVRPRWRLLQQLLEATGPGWYSVAEREERLFTNRSNQPGDDMKDEVRTDDDWHAWRIWSTSWDRFFRLRQPGPPLKFPSEEGILSCIYDQVREEEHVIAVQFLGSQQDVSTSRMKEEASRGCSSLHIVANACNGP